MDVTGCHAGILHAAGLCLVEAGFTRSKNTANILMKNLVDFMVGSILFWFIGFGLMFGIGDVFGTPHLFDLDAMSNIIQNGLPMKLPNLPDRILCHFCYYCVRCHGRTYQILHVSGLHDSHQCIDLSGLRSLDLGRRMAFKCRSGFIHDVCVRLYIP